MRSGAAPTRPLTSRTGLVNGTARLCRMVLGWCPIALSTTSGTLTCVTTETWVRVSEGAGRERPLLLRREIKKCSGCEWALPPSFAALCLFDSSVIARISTQPNAAPLPPHPRQPSVQAPQALALVPSRRVPIGRRVCCDERPEHHIASHPRRRETADNNTPDRRLCTLNSPSDTRPLAHTAACGPAARPKAPRLPHSACRTLRALCQLPSLCAAPASIAASCNRPCPFRRLLPPPARRPAN
jgi:hypothetical protein